MSNQSRLRNARALVALVALLNQGCTNEALRPEDHVFEIVRRDTPEGEAAIQLLVEPQEIQLGDTVSIRIVNRGEVELLTGEPITVQRWEDGQWIKVRVRSNCAFTAGGYVLSPGESMGPRRWPIPNSCYPDVEPGRYQVLKSAMWEDGEHYDDKVRLQGRASFLVRDG